MMRRGLVYVCDRTNDRIQVFRKDGTFVKEFFVEKNTLANGSVWDLDLFPTRRKLGSSTPTAPTTRYARLIATPARFWARSAATAAGRRIPLDSQPRDRLARQRFHDGGRYGKARAKVLVPRRYGVA